MSQRLPRMRPLSSNQHFRKGDRDLQFLNKHKLIEGAYRDWAVTVIFYASLHYVDGLIVKHCGIEAPRSHKDRRQVLRRCRFFNRGRQPLRYDYQDLYNDGLNSRYYGHEFTLDEIQNRILPLVETIRRAARGANSRSSRRPSSP